LNCQENIAQYEEIIRGFDEVIQTKSSKISYDTLNKVVKEDCIKKENLNDFFEKAKKEARENGEAIDL
jgi:hypothetical protein